MTLFNEISSLFVTNLGRSVLPVNALVFSEAKSRWKTKSSVGELQKMYEEQVGEFECWSWILKVLFIESRPR